MPKKTLEEMLKENTVKPGTRDARKRLATFLAYWDEIHDAYKKGWSWMDIYNALFSEGVVDYSYSTFLHYKDRKLRRAWQVEKIEAPKQKVDVAKGAAADRASRNQGSTKIDLPVFGENVKARDPKRF